MGSGIHMVDRLAKMHHIHYHPDKVLCKLSLNGILYTIKLRHQYRYNSSFNIGHTAHRAGLLALQLSSRGVVPPQRAPQAPRPSCLGRSFSP